ncbi:MAG TPA: cyclic nucleotide-binding domain-containing protein [Polyangiaceae bacterium]|nr:cyclic nucleotide-binding domain-containing protein [Polyangiaceae bacterium]
MMHTAPPVFPQALDDDNDDVGWALETAKVQWTRGAYADAIEWLHRAIEAAIDSGRAIRARHLTQQTNALETALQDGWIPDVQEFASEGEAEDGAEPLDLDAYEEISVDVDVESLPPHARHSDAMELDASDLIEDVEEEPVSVLPIHAVRPAPAGSNSPSLGSPQRSARNSALPRPAAGRSSVPAPRPSSAHAQPAHRVATTLRGPAPNLTYGSKAPQSQFHQQQAPQPRSQQQQPSQAQLRQAPQPQLGRSWRQEEELPTENAFDPSAIAEPISSMTSRSLPAFPLEEDTNQTELPLPSFALPDEVEPELKTMPESELPPPIAGVPPLNQLEPAARRREHETTDIEELDPDSLEPETESDAHATIEPEPLTELEPISEIEAISELEQEQERVSAVSPSEVELEHVEPEQTGELLHGAEPENSLEPQQEPETTLISEMLLLSEPPRDSEHTIVQAGPPEEETAQELYAAAPLPDEQATHEELPRESEEPRSASEHGPVSTAPENDGPRASIHPATTTEPSPRGRFASELEPTLVRSNPTLPARVGDIELATIAGLEDLPEAAQQRLATGAWVTTLAPEEEVTHFGLALIVEGTAAVMSTVADASGAQLAARDLALSHGHLQDSVALRLVAQGSGARIATWSEQELEAVLRDCPWVYDDLKTSGDRLQALTGITVGPMGEQLDDMLRAMVVERCSVKHYLPHEVIAEAGRPVPGMIVLGAGRIEVLEPSSERIEENLKPGEFLFPQAILQASPAPATARAGQSGALVVFAERRVAHELLVSVPPLLGIFAQ